MSKNGFGKLADSLSDSLGTSAAIIAVGLLILVLVAVLLAISFGLTWLCLIIINYLLGVLGYSLPFALNWVNVAAVWGILSVIRFVFQSGSSSNSKK